MKVKTRKVLWRLLAAVGVLYVASFVVLAHGGGYDWVASGHFRPMGLLASTDMMVWQPKTGTFYAFRRAGGVDGYQADFLGRFYSPLILLYQKVFAPSIRTVQADGSRPNPAPQLPDREKLHPKMLRQLPEAEKNLGMTWEQIQAKAASP